jgi:hypothetical protein
MIDPDRLQDCLGRDVRVLFMDHAMNDRTLCSCVAHGELIEATNTHLVLRTWHTIDAPGNDEFICLIMSAVKLVNILRDNFLEQNDGDTETDHRLVRPSPVPPGTASV